jgi:hypothetical protein
MQRKWPIALEGISNWGIAHIQTQAIPNLAVKCF